MTERKLNQDIWASVFVFVVGLFTLIVSLTIRVTQTFITSAGLLPLILSIALMLLSVILFTQSWRKGGRFVTKKSDAAQPPETSEQPAAKAEVSDAAEASAPAEDVAAKDAPAKDDETAEKPLTRWQKIKASPMFMTLLNMIVVGLLVFIGVPYLGFFISGAIFMFSILLFRSRKIKWYFSLLITAATMGVLYLVFIVLFKLPIL